MLAIIPARGGSKGLPGKNIRPLGGVPLICHTIKSALEADSITRVIVSTDDDEIASIARSCGADIPFMRPAELATDDSMAMDTYFYTLNKLESEFSEKYDSFVVLLPTVPLRKVDDIDNAVDIFLKNDADSVISVVESPVPIQWYRRIDADGILKAYSDGFDAVNNRQKFGKSYIPNGSIYVFNTKKLEESRLYYMEKTLPYIMPRERSVDIDELLDFKMAEMLYSEL